MRLAIIGDPKSWYLGELCRACESYAEIRDVQIWRYASLTELLGNVPSQITDHAAVPRHAADVLLVRSMPSGSLEQVIFRMDCLQNLAKTGTLVLNSPRSLEIAIDKYMSLAKLRDARVPVPPTIVTQSLEAALAAMEEFGEVVVKPIFGSEGRGLLRISDPELAWRTFKHLTSIGAVLYVQKYIRNHGEDMRYLVIGQQVWGIRRICEGDWRANLAQGARCEPIPVSSFWEELSLRATQAIGAEIAAVDCIEGADGGHYCLEINGVPGWRGLADAHRINVAQIIVQHILHRWRSK